MSLLTAVQNVAVEIGLPEPSLVVSATDTTTKQMMRLLYKVGRDIKRFHWWPELSKDLEITLVDSQEGYDLPADFDRIAFETMWAQNEDWPVIGPMSPQQYKAYKEGITSTSPRQYFRVRGVQGSEIKIFPVPGSGDAGNVIITEYYSCNWFLPKLWEQSTTFASGAYCSYGGNVYQNTVGGVTGTTPPTHTSGSASDGTVTWAYVSEPYSSFLADTDIFVIEQEIVERGLYWHTLRAKGLPYQEAKQEFYRDMTNAMTAKTGARSLSLVGPHSDDGLISERNFPDTGYGT